MRTLTHSDVGYLVRLINGQVDESVILTEDVRDRINDHLVHALAYPVESGGNPQLERCAADLYYSIVKDRALPEGSERLALIVTAAFLADNGNRQPLPTRELYETATRDSSRPGETMRILEDLAVLIFMSIHPLTGDNERAVATTGAQASPLGPA